MLWLTFFSSVFFPRRSSCLVGATQSEKPPLPGIVSMTSGRAFEDPSEPIYTDPSLFERSRSLRSAIFN